MTLNANSVCVRAVPGEADLKITFFYNSVLREFNRSKIDTVSKTFQRISLKLIGKKSKKKKPRQQQAVGENDKDLYEISIALRDGSGNNCVGELSNQDGFTDGNTLVLGGEVYPISLNPPTVSSLSLPENIMSEFLILPDVTLEFGDVEHSVFSWYRSLPDDIDWQPICNEMTYTPTNNDIGYLLKITCKAGSETRSSPFLQDFVTLNPVSAGPGVCVFEQRQMYTSKHHSVNSDEFRVVCYNILADVFATSDFARTTLFPFCPEYVLSMSYRKQLIVKELLGYHADFICLQECGMKLFNTYLRPILKLHGYEGFFDLKLGAMPEGEAFFYRTDRYSHVKDLTVSVRDAMYMDCNGDILAELANAPEILESIHKKTAIGQIHVLRETCGEKDRRQICVLNTHLYYKRFSQHVRILQMAILVNYLEAQLANMEDGENTTVLVCGDLNSLRNDTLLKYLAGTIVDSNDSVWSGLGASKELLNVALQAPRKLQNLSGCPSFTSFVPHCVETLDYIFGDENLKLSAFVPLPTAEELIPYTGIPSLESPSDHLALVLDLKWK